MADMTVEECIEKLDNAKFHPSLSGCCGEVDDDGKCLAPACSWGEHLKACHSGAAHLERLQAENARLREALKPFAKWGHMAVPTVEVSVLDCKAAAAALSAWETLK